MSVNEINDMEGLWGIPGTEFIPDPPDPIIAIEKEIIKPVSDFFEEDVVDVFTDDIPTFFEEDVGGVFTDDIPTFFEEDVSDAFVDAYDWTKTASKDAIDWTASAYKDVAGWVETAYQDVIDWFTELIPGIPSEIMGIVAIIVLLSIGAVILVIVGGAISLTMRTDDGNIDERYRAMQAMMAMSRRRQGYQPAIYDDYGSYQPTQRYDELDRNPSMRYDEL